jgi:cytochrome d ubiquinol oxidase subunit II
METILGIDLPTWWYLVIGAVFTGYAILDGFDLGAGAVHLFFNKEESRRIALNAIGPVWDGNEVWLVIGGGALFAGFPEVYASLFSAFYIPFMLFLVGLIFRAISIEFRSKEKMKWWRNLWDRSYSISSIVITLLLGVLLGNIIQGIKIGEGFVYQGTFLDLLNPYAIVVAITTLSLFMMHGCIYLVMKTENRLYAKLTVMVKNTTNAFIFFYIVLTVYTLYHVPYMDDKFHETPILFGVPVLTVLCVIGIKRLIKNRKYFKAFMLSSATAALLLVTVALNLYPNVLISSIDPAYTINVYNGASSEKSLKIMLIMAAIGVPIVAVYTTFVFWTFRGKVKMDETSY